MSFYKDKLIFITGGSTGIGLAIAKALAKEESHVIIFARTVSKLETALNEIKLVQKNPSQTIKYYSVDTSDNIDIKKIDLKVLYNKLI